MEFKFGIIIMLDLLTKPNQMKHCFAIAFFFLFSQKNFSQISSTSLHFDGFDDVVTVPSQPAYVLGANEFTIEVWFKDEAPQVPFSREVVLSCYPIFSSGGIRLEIYDGNPTLFINGIGYGGNAQFDLRDNQCHHLAVTRDVNGISFYVDGISWGGAATFPDTISATDPWLIGNYEVIPGLFVPFNGELKEIRLWNWALPQLYIQSYMNTVVNSNAPGLTGYWRMNEGTGQTVNDYSPLQNNGTLGSSSSSQTSDPTWITGCTPCTPPATGITPLSPVICPGDSVTLSTPQIAGCTYQWYRNLTIISNATSSSYTATLQGNYQVMVTDSTGCVNGDNEIVIVAPLTPSITGNTGFCTGGSTMLTVTGSYFCYLWSNGTTTQSIVVNTAGTYTVTVCDMNGCTGSASVTVYVFPPPTAVISANGPLSFCIGDSVLLSVSPTFMSYQWLRNGVPLPVAAQSIWIKARGNYQCTVTNANGCTGTSNSLIARTPCIDISPPELKTGAGKDASVSFLQIMPNPAGDFVLLKLNLSREMQVGIRIVDISGKEILSATLHTKNCIAEKVFDISALPQALYFIYVAAGNERWVEKIVRR